MPKPQAPELEGLSLADWLATTQERREAITAHGKKPMSTDIGERSSDQDLTINLSQDAGDLLADAEWFLTQETARATLAARKKYDKLSVDERRIMVKAEVADLQRLCDSLSVDVQVLRSRLFHGMNQNRSRP